MDKQDKISKTTLYFKVARLFVAFLLVLLSLGLSVSISQGQTGGWSTPVQLSSNDTFSWFPDVATDQTGRVHVVWSSGFRMKDDKAGRAYDTVMYTSSQDGVQWDKVVDTVAFLQIAGSEATRPTLFMDQRGTLHLTCRFTEVYYSNVPAQFALNAAAWLPKRQISTSQVAYFSRLAVDSQGQLHLIFTENVPSPDCPVCFHLFYRSSHNNGLSWSSLSDISKLPTGAAKPQILIDDQDNLHVVWVAGRGGAYGQLSGPTTVKYTASYDGGESWSAPIEFVAPGGEADHITIGLDGRGQLVVVWSGTMDKLVYYQTSNDRGRSWSPPRPIPGLWAGSVTRLDDYAIATDSNDQIHLVLVGRTSKNQPSLDVLHLTWNGSTWLPPQVVTTLIDDVPEWPRLAVGNGNQLHVVWFVRDAETLWQSDLAKYKVWYARGFADAPAIAPIPWPTPIPTPTPPEMEIPPTMTPTPRPSPTATATLDPSAVQLVIPAGATGSIYTDNDEVVLIGASLLPAILIIGAVIFIVLRQRS